MDPVAIVLLIVGLLLLVGGGVFVATRRRPAPPAPPSKEPAAVAVEEAPVAPVERVEAPVAPVERVEAPDPTKGRLVRLRARLARSQSVFGKGLLGLLSRDHLDDDAWDEVEESLIGADVGVKATTEIVARLREQVRVLGTRTPDQLRTLLAEELTHALDPSLD
ncbi:signal recognition particle receptor subunit alpha, partial [Allorhizocola rhizosphaerae]|uniref:signal recognition particle receptor subunit alpha n=1 Tax=Allorhizocola rhizosphaerae TaxID=1872709 RepID=UPI003CCC882F